MHEYDQIQQGERSKNFLASMQAHVKFAYSGSVYSHSWSD